MTAGLDVPVDNVSFEKLSINGKALRFMIEETSMVFMYDYYENGELIRSVVNQEDMNVQEEGEPLDIEETETDCTAIITHLMALVTGESINTLALNTPSEKYEVSINS